MTLRERWHQVKDWLKHARERVWAARKGRKDADPGSRERKRLAEVQARREAIRDRLAEREEKLRKRIEARQNQAGQLDPDGDGLAVLDGKLVALWIAEDIREAQTRGLLPASGIVLSGFRSPELSESICISYCGQPTCSSPPCAGRYSRHAQKGDGQGAVDVFPAVRDQFARAMQAIGSRLHNALPTDTNHFSAQGN